MNQHNHKNIHTYLLLIFASLIITTYSDCPISRYHSQFKLGQAKVTQSQSTNIDSSILNYTYTLDSLLLKPNPTIIIGLTGFAYTVSNNSIEFQIVDIKDPTSLSTVSFTITSKGAIQNSRIFSFRFLAVERKFTSIQGGTFKNTPINNSISKNITLSAPSTGLNTEIAIFINGVKGSNISQLFSIQLLNPQFDQKSLTFQIKSSDSAAKISKISYSFLMYNKIQFSQQNQISLKYIQFTTSDSNILTLPSFSFTDLTFYGFSMISIANSGINAIDLILDAQNNLALQSNSKFRLFQVLIWQSFIKQQYVCSFCKNASILYDGRFCVKKCPGDYIPQQGDFIQECKKCSIQQVRVPDSLKKQCVCATQYFEKSSNGECTACHYTCFTCVGEQNTDCLTCDVDSKQKLTFRQLNKAKGGLTGKCLCPASKFYEEDLNTRCLSCHPDCNSCTGPSDTDCINCNKQRQKNDLGMCQCKTGYTSQVDGSCSCLNPRYQVNGACVDPLNSCGLNQVEVVQNLKGNNKNKTSTKSCQCKSGYAKVKGQCLPCGQNQEYNDKKGVCKCVKQATKLSNGTCLICSSDKKFDKQTQSCICKNKNSGLNSKGECISCPQKSIFYDDLCYCINNYFMNDKRKCQKCKKNTDNTQCKKSSDNQL